MLCRDFQSVETDRRAVRHVLCHALIAIGCDRKREGYISDARECFQKARALFPWEKVYQEAISQIWEETQIDPIHFKEVSDTESENQDKKAREENTIPSFASLLKNPA